MCNAIQPVANQTLIHILQHPSETKHAKNTARLLSLCLAQCCIWPGESAEDFAQLQKSLAHYLPKEVALVYPGERAQVIPQAVSPLKKTKCLLLLDGTWRKAYKLFQLNPWLGDYQQFTLDNALIAKRLGGYSIRKAPAKHCLSTLECTALCLEALEDCDTQPLYNCLTELQTHFNRHRQS